METVKLRMPFDDRMGLLLDITRALLKFELNIVALQLMNRVVFVEIENLRPQDWGRLVAELAGIPAILAVERITDMPYQSREKQIDAIISSISPLTDRPDSFKEIIGESPVFKAAVNLARQVAATESAILLRGESGTGKELFARALHLASGRREKVLVPLNCGAIPENLLESELFGYVDGAFSGARKGGRVGLFQFAAGGTIFLDEITELPPALQVKLLRVLQEDRVRPLGANEEIPVDCRIIAATNRNIEALMQKGLFREDLYYRLNVIPIQVPPLRRHKDDIGLLARHWLAKYRKAGGVKKSLSAAALAKLMDYEWPGNVRELENVLERAWHLSGETEIQPGDILFDTLAGPTEAGGYTAGDAVRMERGRLKEAAAETEREIIESALRTGGSIRRAAQALGVSHTTLANKVKKYGIGRSGSGNNGTGKKM